MTNPVTVTPFSHELAAHKSNDAHPPIHLHGENPECHSLKVDDFLMIDDRDYRIGAIKINDVEIDDTPLVQGGQGRDNEDVDKRMDMLITLALLAAMMAVVGATMALAYWCGSMEVKP